MSARTAKTSSAERLRASPNFVLAFTLDGRPYVAKETEPYIQYWLTERYRILLAMFSVRRGATTAEAVEGYLRLTCTARSEAECKRLFKAIEDMRAAGVLAATRDDVSRYNKRIVEAYVAHRPFPRELSDLIIRSAPITASSRVLDLAGGPGDLALALAQTSSHVSLMELSRGFLNAAARRAKQRGVNLTPLHESCNRLVFQEDEYDVVTVSQALHWLDDVQVCRGICRVLRPGGSFFVIHGALELEDEHPLSFVLGNKSILGHKIGGSFAAHVQPLLKRLTLLFEALDAPDVHRVDIAQQWVAPGEGATGQIIPAGVSFFRQRRPIGVGFAHAFLTPQHIALTGLTPSAFWLDLETRCAAATPEQIIGTQDWAVLHFRRGGVRAELCPLEPCEVVEIGY